MTPPTAAPPATRHIGKSAPRIDGLEKTTGQTKYLGDFTFEGTLWGRVLRAAHPHALIRGIDTSRAEALPGVHAVLTHRDVKGLNRFGIAKPDQPVLCEEKVRYVGDAVALVLADDEATAERARSLIDVAYEPLPVVDEMLEALEPGAPEVHTGGNLMHENRVTKGDIETGLRESEVTLHHTFRTQMYAHAFLELDSGSALFDPEAGTITVWCAGQYPYRDQLLLQRLKKKKLRIKDEIERLKDDMIPDLNA